MSAQATAPRRNPAGGGHKGRVRARALELLEAGWSYYATARLMRREGMPVAQSTLKRWADPEFHRAEIERAARNGRQRRATNRRPAACYTEEFKVERMRELRDRGLSFAAIGQVAAVWWGDELPDDAVSRILGSIDGRRAYRKTRTVAA